MHLMELLGDVGNVSLRLEIVLVSVQDRCTDCTKRTIGSEIVLDTPDGILGDNTDVKARSIWR
jgi:hypothetical protein